MKRAPASPKSVREDPIAGAGAKAALGGSIPHTFTAPECRMATCPVVRQSPPAASGPHVTEEASIELGLKAAEIPIYARHLDDSLGRAATITEHGFFVHPNFTVAPLLSQHLLKDLIVLSEAILADTSGASNTISTERFELALTRCEDHCGRLESP